MKKFNVNIIAVLEPIMKKNTLHYQCDFDLDMKTFKRMANSKEKEDKHLVWLSRPNGTWCLNEREVYIIGSFDYNVLQYYTDSEEGKLIQAFLVDITGEQNGLVLGNIHQVDYLQYAAEVKKNAIQAAHVELQCENGIVIEGINTRFTKSHPIFGAIQQRKYLSDKDEDELSDILAEQRKRRVYHEKKQRPKKKVGSA